MSEREAAKRERARQRKRVRLMQRQAVNLRRRAPMREEILGTWSPASGEFYCGDDMGWCRELCELAQAVTGYDSLNAQSEPESVNRGRLRPMCGVWADQLRTSGRNER